MMQSCQSATPHLDIHAKETCTMWRKKPREDVHHIPNCSDKKLEKIEISYIRKKNEVQYIHKI